MRSTLLIGCLLLAVVYVHSMSRIERHISIQKRAASPQIYQGAQSNNWNQTQFQWVKVNNQWVRRDGTNQLPGYSSPNVPYNQTGNKNVTPTPSRGAPSPAQPSGPSTGIPTKPGQQQPAVAHVTPQRQGSTSSQGSIGWDPSADRALTQDLPKTTPRPTTTTSKTTTTTTTRAPQTIPSIQKPVGPTPTPARAPFGSGIVGPQKPQNNRYNPDASLTYDGLPPRTNPASNKPTMKPSTGSRSSNPWAGL